MDKNDLRKLRVEINKRNNNRGIDEYLEGIKSLVDKQEKEIIKLNEVIAQPESMKVERLKREILELKQSQGQSFALTDKQWKQFNDFKKANSSKQVYISFSHTGIGLTVKASTIEGNEIKSEDLTDFDSW